MTRYGLVDSDDDDDIDDHQEKVKIIDNKYKSPLLFESISHDNNKSQSFSEEQYYDEKIKKSPNKKAVVFIPDGVDPLFYKSAQRYFRRQSEEGSIQEPEPIIHYNNKMQSPIISPLTLKQFSPEPIKSYPLERPTLDLINFYMNTTQAFYSIEESPCLKILKSVKESMGSSTEGLRKNIRSFTSMTSPKRPVDYALSLGRSFRVGWSANGKIAHFGKKAFSTDSEHGKRFRVVIEGIKKN